ncbi:MAG: glycosyltransferase family 4 protein [Flavobacteriaceae bacterium]
MKIGMILDKNFPPDPRVENEALSLVKAGHDISLFCLGSRNETFNYKGISVFRFKQSVFDYKMGALAYEFPYYNWKLSLEIKDFIKNSKVEVLHIHDIRPAGAVYKANKEFQLPCVLDLHDNYPEIMQYYPHYKKFPGNVLIQPKLWKKAEGKYIRKSKRVISVSPEFIKDLKMRFPDQEGKFILVPNSIRRSFYQEAVLDKKLVSRLKENYTLLYLGDTGLRRGLLTAIESVAILKNTIPKIKLVIVGSNSTDQILKDKAIELGCEDQVEFAGWRDVSLFPSYISGAQIGLSPLLRNVQHDVAYANKIFQYMGFEKPVIASDCPAQAKLIEQNKAGLVYTAGDAQELAKSVIELYDNKEKATILGKNGFNFIDQEFCWEESSKKLIELYASFNH